MTEAPRSRRGPSLLFTIVVPVLVIALGVEAFLLLRPSPARGKARPRAAQEAIARAGDQQVETFGDPAAPIQVKLYAPLTLEWHEKTIGLLRQYDKDHPGRLRVTLMPMGNSECDTEMQSKGHSCAVILINGEYDFTLPDGRTVTLEKNPNSKTSSYNSEDAITILDQLAAKHK
jgi:hypothetical protein